MSILATHAMRWEPLRRSNRYDNSFEAVAGEVKLKNQSQMGFLKRTPAFVVLVTIKAN